MKFSNNPFDTKIILLYNNYVIQRDKGYKIMTRKQMKKLAKELYKCEQIHQSDSSSKEEKSQADNRIMQITNQIMALNDGINIMLEIDVMVQDLATK